MLRCCGKARALDRDIKDHPRSGSSNPVIDSEFAAEPDDARIVHRRQRKPIEIIGDRNNLWELVVQCMPGALDARSAPSMRLITGARYDLANDDAQRARLEATSRISGSHSLRSRRVRSSRFAPAFARRRRYLAPGYTLFSG